MGSQEPYQSPVRCSASISMIFDEVEVRGGGVQKGRLFCRLPKGHAQQHEGTVLWMDLPPAPAPEEENVAKAK